MLSKSAAYVKPFARMVLTKKMSLKSALDKVPWFMQNELLNYLRQRIKKSVRYSYDDDVYLDAKLFKSYKDSGEVKHFINTEVV